MASTRGKTNKPEEDLHTVVKTLVTKLCCSEDFLNQITKTIVNTLSEKYEGRLKTLENENSLLKNEVKELKKTYEQIQTKNKTYESELKKKSVRIFGLNESKNEKCSDFIIDLFVDKMGMHINKSDIDHCFRVGKYEANKIRPLLVKFLRMDTKNEVYNNKKKLKGSGIIIREELTKEKMELVKSASNKLGKNASIWTNGGNVFGKKGDNVIRIDSLDDIKKFG